MIEYPILFNPISLIDKNKPESISECRVAVLWELLRRNPLFVADVKELESELIEGRQQFINNLNNHEILMYLEGKKHWEEKKFSEFKNDISNHTRTRKLENGQEMSLWEDLRKVIGFWSYQYGESRKSYDILKSINTKTDNYMARFIYQAMESYSCVEDTECLIFADLHFAHHLDQDWGKLPVTLKDKMIEEPTEFSVEYDRNDQLLNYEIKVPLELPFAGVSRKTIKVLKKQAIKVFETALKEHIGKYEFLCENAYGSYALWDDFLACEYVTNNLDTLRGEYPYDHSGVTDKVISGVIAWYFSRRNKWSVDYRVGTKKNDREATRRSDVIVGVYRRFRNDLGGCGYIFDVYPEFKIRPIRG